MCSSLTQAICMIRDPFDGLPLKAWAEKLGERVMPAYELIKEEQAAAKRAAKALGTKVEAQLSVPSIPHVLPFTRWCLLPAPCLLPRPQPLSCKRSNRCMSSLFVVDVRDIHRQVLWDACYLPIHSTAAGETPPRAHAAAGRGCSGTYLVAEPCWMCRASNSKVIQNTFVADEGKGRKKARLSWYHPDDTVSISAHAAPMLADDSTVG